MVYISSQNILGDSEGRKDVLNTDRLLSRTGEESSLTKDDVFSLLSNRRRRLVLHHLNRRSDAASVRELSHQVAVWENDVAADELTYKQRKRVYTSLHQTHLPKLDDVGVVVYDRKRGTVSLTETAAELEPYLQIQSDPTESWAVFYLSLAGLTGAFVLCAWANLYPFRLLPDIAYGAFTTLAFTVSAAAHTLQTRAATVDPHSAPPDSVRPQARQLEEARPVRRNGDDD
jgi:hypothetical protein